MSWLFSILTIDLDMVIGKHQELYCSRKCFFARAKKKNRSCRAFGSDSSAKVVLLRTFVSFSNLNGGDCLEILTMIPSSYGFMKIASNTCTFLSLPPPSPRIRYVHYNRILKENLSIITNGELTSWIFHLSRPEQIKRFWEHLLSRSRSHIVIDFWIFVWNRSQIIVDSFQLLSFLIDSRMNGKLPNTF